MIQKYFNLNLPWDTVTYDPYEPNYEWTWPYPIKKKIIEKYDKDGNLIERIIKQ